VTYPQSPQPGPRPGPPPGGYRPGPPVPRDSTFRPEATQPEAAQLEGAWREGAQSEEDSRPVEWDGDVAGERAGTAVGGDGTGHPAVDAVLRSLANAAQLAPADQIAEYEAAHRVLQETLSSIDG
jgi:hypothetical protein